MHDASAVPYDPSGPAFSVRVELADFLGDAEVRAELADDPAHWLHELRPRIRTGPAGRVSIELTVPGSDVWTCTLTVMAVLRHVGYAMHSLHVQGRDDREQRPAA